MDGQERIEVDAEGGHRSLMEHATNKALDARARIGPDIGYSDLLALLQDASVVRYPTRIAFDTVGLQAGMLAYAQQCGSVPGDGFVLHVHPHFEGRSEDLRLLISYYLVSVNYGEVADAAVAECFGATLLGMDIEEYYQRLCSLADELDA
jgi:hypothetical protein